MGDLAELQELSMLTADQMQVGIFLGLILKRAQEGEESLAAAAAPPHGKKVRQQRLGTSHQIPPGFHPGVPKGDVWQDPTVAVSWQRTRCLLFGEFIGRRRTKYLED